MRRIIGAVLLLVGLSGAGVSLLALLDPAAAQLSNDAAPFAAPPPWTETAAILLASILLAATGILLIFRRSTHRTRAP